jgi:hypothetical protein
MQKKILQNTSIGKEAPSLIAYDLRGKIVKITSNTKWKVVTFWSTACPCVMQCQKTSLIPLWRRYHNQVDFWAIASNDANLGYHEDKVYLKLAGDIDQRPPYPLVLDNRHAVADSLGATNTPQTFLLSPKNQLVFVGDPDNSFQIANPQLIRHYLRDALTESLKNKIVSQPVAPVRGCQIGRAKSLTH